MKLVKDTINLAELEKMKWKMNRNMVKAVVDVSQEIMGIDAEFHSDIEEFLLEEQGSEQDDLWGINLHPDHFATNQWVEFDSMINIRPSQGNRSRYVENAELRKKIISIVDKLVKL